MWLHLRGGRMQTCLAAKFCLHLRVRFRGGYRTRYLWLGLLSPCAILVIANWSCATATDFLTVRIMHSAVLSTEPFPFVWISGLARTCMAKRVRSCAPYSEETRHGVGFQRRRFSRSEEHTSELQ